mgnify:CR=1 FL=1
MKSKTIKNIVFYIALIPYAVLEFDSFFVYTDIADFVNIYHYLCDCKKERREKEKIFRKITSLRSDFSAR